MPPWRLCVALQLFPRQALAADLATTARALVWGTYVPVLSTPTDLRHYFWDDPHLYKEGLHGVIRHCVPEHEHEQILRKCHSKAYGGHHVGDRTAHKVLQSGFIGLLSSRMPVSLFYLMMNVKELVILASVKK